MKILRDSADLLVRAKSSLDLEFDFKNGASLDFNSLFFLAAHSFGKHMIHP